MHVIHANDLYRFVSGVGAGNPGSGPSVPTASDSLQKSAAKSSGPRISTGTLFLRTRTLSNRVKSIGLSRPAGSLTDAGAVVRIEQFDGLRHGVGVLPVAVHCNRRAPRLRCVLVRYRENNGSTQRRLRARLFAVRWVFAHLLPHTQEYGTRSPLSSMTCASPLEAIPWHLQGLPSSIRSAQAEKLLLWAWLDAHLCAPQSILCAENRLRLSGSGL